MSYVYVEAFRHVMCKFHSYALLGESKCFPIHSQFTIIRFITQSKHAKHGLVLYSVTYEAY
jgi:hypothetical protein